MNQSPCRLALAALTLLCLGFPARALTPVSGTLTGSIHWTQAGSPYRLTGDTIVAAAATLTVDPGVRVEATGAYALTIAGTLLVPAPGGNRAVFTSTSSSPGSWGGVVLASGATATVSGADFMFGATCLTVDGAQASFTNCRFSYASQDGAVVYNQAQFTAQDCIFGHNGRRGLYLETVYPQGSVTDCSFNYNGEYPLFSKANCVGMLGSGLSFIRNAHQEIAVSTSAATDIQRSQTWTSQPLPLNLAAESTGELTIPAGVTLTLRPSLRVIGTRLDVAGGLVCGQAGAAQVKLVGPAATPGSWEGVRVLPGGAAEFHSTVLRYATTAVSAESATVIATGSEFLSSQFDGLRMAGSSQLTASDCLLQGNGRNGIRLTGPASGSIAQTRFRSNADYPIYVEARNAGLLGRGNSYWANARQAVGVACGGDPDLATSAIWSNQGIPYDLTARPTDATLAIGAGATLSLGLGTALLGGGLDVYGTLNATGGPGRPVEFLPAVGATPGSWLGITFHPGSGGSLRNCTIDRAETGVALLSASPTLTYCAIRHCRYAAVDCQGAAAPVLATCFLTDNQGDGVATSDTAQPNLGNLGNASAADDGRNVLRNNGDYDIRHRSSRPLLAQNNWWETGDAGAIAVRIYDGSDHAGYGIVTFSPFLSPAGRPAPVLVWTGEAGYVSSGVSPAQGLPQAKYDFRVKYLSAQGRVPRYVRLYLYAGEDAYPGSPFALKYRSGTSARSGLIYGVSVRLPASRDFSYRLEAADTLLPATGAPTGTQSGPLVNTAPTLQWAGGNHYPTDGVYPTTGSAGGTFVFRIKYRDANANPPTAVLLYLERGGVPVAGSPFAMGWEWGTMSGGAVYEQVLLLTAGSYRYRFAADDGLAAATGAPTNWKTGPQVGTGVSSVMTSVSALPAPGGRAEIRCRLAQAADLTITVRNLAGRPVATVVSGLPCEVGERVILWNRRSAHGTLLPRGTYFLEAVARSPHGSLSRQTVTLTLR